MIYIFETEIPSKKSVFFGIQKIYGLGKSTAGLVCKKLGFPKTTKFKKLKKRHIKKLIIIIKSLNLNFVSNLRRRRKDRAAKKTFIKSYKGLRLLKGLPIRGQRTHSNAKTSKRLKPRVLSPKAKSLLFY